MMKKLGKWLRRPDESGQVEVETAIVMPMVVFLLLGLIQMGLLNQARIMAKYAAYRAVRWAVTHNIDSSDDLSGIEQAAVQAALPVLTYGLSADSAILGKTDDALNWYKKFSDPTHMFTLNKISACPTMKIAEILICGPLQDDVTTYSGCSGDDVVSFDDVNVAGTGIKTKLRIQLKLNYRMVIPFANAVIYRMWQGEQLPYNLHLGKGSAAAIDSDTTRFMCAEAGVYVIPLLAQYSMKMHSDFKKSLLPSSHPDDCHE